MIGIKDPPAYSRLKRWLGDEAREYYLEMNRETSLGVHATEAFKKDKRPMRSLENIAYGTADVTDIFDFIKRQTGKTTRKEKWRYFMEGEELEFGPRLLEKLENLRKKAEEIRKQVLGEEVSEPQRRDRELDIHLELVQSYIRHLVSHFLYQYKGRGDWGN